MKSRTIWLILLIFGAVGGVSGQGAKSGIQFDAFDEDGKFFADLKSSDVQIEGAKDLSVTLRTDKALEIVIMIDASASQESVLPSGKKAARVFIDEFLKAGRDKVAVVSFSGKVGLEQELTGDLMKAKAQIDKIRFVPPAGYVGGGVVVAAPLPPNKDLMLAASTSIWDSLTEVLDAVTKIQDAGAQRAVLLISDGFNTYGKTKLEQAIEHSVRLGIPIYAVGIGDDYYEGVDKKTLKKLTAETGGVAIVPKKKLEDLSPLLERIGSALRSGYELTFEQNSPATGGKLRKIKIEIANPDLRKRKLQIIQPRGVFAAN